MIYLETDDAGAFFRFTDTYAKIIGGADVAGDGSADGRVQRRRKALSTSAISPCKGEAALDRAVADATGRTRRRRVVLARCARSSPGRTASSRSAMASCSGPTIGATIEGNIDYPGNQVRMSGTFVPLYGLNNMFGQIPIRRSVSRRRQQ